MKKLTENERKEIVMLCSIDTTKENIKQVASNYDITPRYIYKLLKTDRKQEIENSIKENNDMFTKKTDAIIIKLLDKISDKIENENVTLSQLSTTLGILYDKNRLEKNLSTTNKAIEINIKVEK